MAAELLLEAVADRANRAGRHSEHVSDIAVARDRSLWLLSDKSRSIGRLSLATPLRPADDEIAVLDEVWRLPKKATKPEGAAALDQDRVLIAMDTTSTERNGMIVRRPA